MPTAPPTFLAAYSPSPDWSTSSSPKTQSVTTPGNDVIVVLGGTQNASTTLGTPTGGGNTYNLQQNSLVASTCAGYSWSTGGSPEQLAVTTASLPSGNQNSAYTAALAASGGSGQGYTWSVSSGSLPAGLSLAASTGVISGTPTGTGTTNFTVHVSDSGSNAASKPLGITVSASTQPNGPPGTWTLVFEDDFNGTSLNTSNWTALEGASINNVTTHASNVSVQGGNLILTLTSSSSGAAVNSNPANDSYGSGANGPVLAIGDCVEARVNFPGSGSNIYNWPAWWASGDNWPTNGEIDIAEGLGQLTTNYHGNSSQNGPAPSGTWSNSFHIYTAVRGSSSISVYWDGSLVWTHATNDDGGPQSLLINVGSGEGPAVFGTGSQVLVDYVRMWTPG